MRNQTRATQGTPEHIVRIEIGDPADRKKALSESIARRAHEIFQCRGCVPGHDLDDWLQAEAEILRPQFCGVLELEDRIIVTTDLSRFPTREIDVSIEPRRIVIAGTMLREGPEKARNTPGSQSVFRAFRLPVEVNATKVTARLKHSILELELPRAVPAKNALVGRKAA